MNNKKIVKDLAFKYNRDSRVIDTITRHPFKYLYELMQSEDERPYRIKYLGIFAMKNSKKTRGRLVLGLL